MAQPVIICGIPVAGWLNFARMAAGWHHSSQQATGMLAGLHSRPSHHSSQPALPVIPVAGLLAFWVKPISPAMLAGYLAGMAAGPKMLPASFWNCWQCWHSGPIHHSCQPALPGYQPASPAILTGWLAFGLGWLAGMVASTAGIPVAGCLEWWPGQECRQCWLAAMVAGPRMPAPLPF